MFTRKNSNQIFTYIKKAYVFTYAPDCRQTDIRLAEGFGKQLRFPSGIRRQNSFLPRKTAGFKAFLLMEPVCFYNCINSSKS
nr:MAG TPA: hypothetical protein [Caudoviricetes sp.]